MNNDFIIYVDFDSTLYNTGIFADDLYELIAGKSGLPVDQIRTESASYFFHPSLGGYEYEKHVTRYGLDIADMWSALNDLVEERNYLYQDAVPFLRLLFDNGHNPKILTFGEEHFQLAKIKPVTRYLMEVHDMPAIEVVVVSEKKYKIIKALHPSQKGVLIDDKPDQDLPYGFTEIHLQRGKDITAIDVKSDVVIVSDLMQAAMVISALGK